VYNFKTEEMTLENGEKITDILNPKNHIPFRQEDWARLILSIPFMIMGIYSFINGMYNLILFAFPGPYIIFHLLKRWIKVYQTRYYLTDKRLIIFDSKKNVIDHSFYYRDFPKMTLRENAYNYGFIIIGELEELLEGTDTPFRFPMRSGLNLKDHKIVIDNIQNVRKLYNLIQEKIEKEKLHTTAVL
jgi:hypothetical protein